jgi:hypothetical protein
MRSIDWKSCLAGLVLLPVLAGCGALGHRGSDCGPGSLHDGGSAIPATERPEPGGLLLRTGAIQLGPGLGRNAYSWQGDAHLGFFK